jgi:hypothetical protein
MNRALLSNLSQVASGHPPTNTHTHTLSLFLVSMPVFSLTFVFLRILAFFFSLNTYLCSSINILFFPFKHCLRTLNVSPPPVVRLHRSFLFETAFGKVPPTIVFEFLVFRKRSSNDMLLAYSPSTFLFPHSNVI